MVDFRDKAGIMEKLRASGAIAPEAPTVKTLNDTHLRGVDCDKCGNMGYTITVKDGREYCVECICMVKRRALLNARKSGLDGLFEEYTFKNYKTPNDRYKLIKNKAAEYITLGKGKWFYISGTPGSGKTHICTAICSGLLKKGETVKYVIWREIAQKLKAAINSAEYVEIIDSLKRPQCLYIDDFMKGSITEADINRAIEIINARYNMPNKRTIISSELDVKDIRRIDEAVGGRIYQRSKGYCFKTPDVNWRN